ncbi:MAG: hypothetical protein ACK400_02300, partial [Pseudanabaena sp.]
MSKQFNIIIIKSKRRFSKIEVSLSQNLVETIHELFLRDFIAIATCIRTNQNPKDEWRGAPPPRNFWGFFSKQKKKFVDIWWYRSCGIGNNCINFEKKMKSLKPILIVTG